MATNFPTSVDVLTNPTANDSLNAPSHSLQHTNANDAIEAIETKLGIGNSPAGSAVAGALLQANGSGSTSWIANTSGLVFIKSQTIGSGVTSVSVSDAFTSTYANYYITFTGFYNSGSDAVMTLKVNNSTTYATTFTTTAFSGGAVSGTGTSSTGAGVYVGLTSPPIQSFAVSVFNPFDTTRTTIVSGGNIGVSVTLNSGLGTSVDNNSSSSFSLNIGSSQTITGGIIRVYGIRNS